MVLFSTRPTSAAIHNINKLLISCESIHHIIQGLSNSSDVHTRPPTWHLNVLETELTQT